MPMTSLVSQHTEQPQTATAPPAAAAIVPAMDPSPTPSPPPDEWYEGAEKLLEIWFSPSSNQLPASSPTSDHKHTDERVGLRAIPRADLEHLLAQVRCTILHAASYQYMDSYVLSESSMFVTPYRLILKTCGTTSLLPAVPEILKLAKAQGLHQVWELFFSRRSFGRPELQPFPHQNFDHEARYLAKHFDGHAETLGEDDRWHLFMLNRHLPLDFVDQTFEVIMNDLHPDAMKIFFQKPGRTSALVTKESGIAELFPGAHIDDFLFDPCGYSMNGVLDDGYFTIHVTPQSEFSYVSFETDIPLHSYRALMLKLMAIFRPGRLIATLFVNEEGVCHHDSLEDEYPGYRVRSTSTRNLQSYKLHFANLVALQQ